MAGRTWIRLSANKEEWRRTGEMTFQSQPISQRPMKDDSYDKNYKDARKNWDPVTAALMWIENNSQNIEKYFERIPAYISNYIATLAIFTFGATLREIYNMFTSQNLKMENFGFIFIISHIWYYYTNRRHVAHEWKIQPTKWLSPELERHEIMVGVVSLFITGSFSAFLATYIANENPSSVYFQFNEYGDSYSSLRNYARTVHKLPATVPVSCSLAAFLHSGIWFGTMRKNNRVYTEKTFHGEAPTIDSPEAKEIIDSDPEIKETVKKIKSSLNLE
ncbi:unnamed protein product [Leptidea sinapis]|uniref:Uncharacterized protein n=1 Tax=Leptidea sinapis TaxID=189913 RepID=A0A5E4PTI6_9NEOP|nr:unnamed protein product [Leptidea sinapis]